MTTTPLDKHSRPIREGDTVQAVHFGEQHRFAVERISAEHGLHYLHGRVAIKVPAAGAELAAGEPGEDAGPVARTPQSTGYPEHPPVQRRAPAARRAVPVREELPAHAATTEVPHSPPDRT